MASRAGGDGYKIFTLGHCREPRSERVLEPKVVEDLFGVRVGVRVRVRVRARFRVRITVRARVMVLEPSDVEDLFGGGGESGGKAQGPGRSCSVRAG